MISSGVLLEDLLTDIRPNILIHMSQLISSTDNDAASLADTLGNDTFLEVYNIPTCCPDVRE